MTGPRVPDAIRDAAHARSRARAVRDWAEADRLKAVIERGGWKVVDRGTDFALAPAAPPDVVEEGRVRYGSSGSVPSRLDEAPVGVATIVVVATGQPDDLERALSALREHGPDGTQLVVVANAPSAAQAAALEALEAAGPGAPGIATEVVWTSDRLGAAAALNAGIRRAGAPVVVLLDASVEPTGDLVTPLAGALRDEKVAVAGPWGRASRTPGAAGLRELEPASGIVDVIEAACLAFRRADYVERGPLDEHFRHAAWLDAWWSLVLREPRGETGERVALAVEDVAALRHDTRATAETPDDHRLAKRNFYRLLDRFRGHDELLKAER